jgi:hypothetical protein
MGDHAGIEHHRKAIEHMPTAPTIIMSRLTAITAGPN